MPESKPLSFLAACRDYFGLKSGQSAMEFLKELKELTPADKAEIAQGLELNGYKIVPINT